MANETPLANAMSRIHLGGSAPNPAAVATTSSEATSSNTGTSTSRSSSSRRTSFTCSICLSNVLRQPIAGVCGHVFCWDHLQTWLKINNRCPICSKILLLPQKLLLVIPLFDDTSVRALEEPDSLLEEMIGIFHRLKAMVRLNRMAVERGNLVVEMFQDGTRPTALARIQQLESQYDLEEQAMDKEIRERTAARTNFRPEE